MNTTNKLIFTGAILSLFALVSCGEKKNQEHTVPNSPVQVIVGTAGTQVANGNFEITGQVEGIQSANISTRVMGTITSMRVKAGDLVKQGQVLFTINATDIKAKSSQTDAMIVQAEAAYKNAQKDYERYTALYKQQSATAKELEQIALQYASAKANLEATKQMKNEVNANLAYTTVTAPFSGVISQKNAETGSIASPGMPILTLEQTGSLQVSAMVPENLIAGISNGQEVEIYVQAVDKKIKGKVIQINPSSQFTGGQYIVKIGMPQAEMKNLYSGMYTKVLVPIKGNSSIDNANINITIPEQALVYKNQLTGIYTISADNTALLRWIRTGKNQSGQIEVLSGLSNGEKYIQSAKGNLYNGVPVTISK
ncbi:efflux RND transporter periplasmic adaptor subunit [Sediminibacterium sp. TEGAF015]|uniref:efflux RND transporter periplasmic adaptor subunit n=1 Tax=Sediminibacterium sp. TEGAF015 TaxID=575378 RepID=UPI00220168A3|nr:efflux RND transporter periplasmic adaptor subunit [Sediminibacterium sp. TEGAF015]BDQ12909.1 RND transporter [Sediminibacterium sp. TEGAF015]